jgi:hypothetical protein
VPFERWCFQQILDGADHWHIILKDSAIYLTGGFTKSKSTKRAGGLCQHGRCHKQTLHRNKKPVYGFGGFHHFQLHYSYSQIRSGFFLWISISKPKSVSTHQPDAERATFLSVSNGESAQF